jgi:hypothetical protein
VPSFFRACVRVLTSHRQTTPDAPVQQQEWVARGHIPPPLPPASSDFSRGVLTSGWVVSSKNCGLWPCVAPSPTH